VPADVPINAPKGFENGTQHLKGLTIYIIRRIGGYIEPPFVNCILSGKVEDDWSNERQKPCRNQVYYRHFDVGLLITQVPMMKNKFQECV